MAAKKKTATASAPPEHQRKSPYLSHAQKRVFARATPRVATVAPAETKAKRSSAKKTSAKKATTTAAARKRTTAKKTAAAETPAAAE